MEILLKLLVAAARAAIIIWGLMHFPILLIFMFLTFVIFRLIVDA